MSSAIDPEIRKEVQRLYTDHHRWLQGWLHSRLGCPQQSADLTQDTFVRVLGASGLSELREPRAFLVALAKRVLFSFWRRREIEQAYLEVLASLPEEHCPSEEERLMVQEAVLAIDQILDGLPSLVRQAFLLNRLDGLSHPRIAAQLGISVPTVERYVRRALIHCYLVRQEAP